MVVLSYVNGIGHLMLYALHTSIEMKQFILFSTFIFCNSIALIKYNLHNIQYESFLYHCKFVTFALFFFVNTPSVDIHRKLLYQIYTTISFRTQRFNCRIDTQIV